MASDTTQITKAFFQKQCDNDNTDAWRVIDNLMSLPIHAFPSFMYSMSNLFTRGIYVALMSDL